MDIITASANSAIFAAPEGTDFKFVASNSKESSRGFFAKFMVKPDSTVKSVKDLKGRTNSIHGFSGSGHLWTKCAPKGTPTPIVTRLAEAVSWHTATSR